MGAFSGITKREIYGSIVLILLYVLLGNARGVQPNPFIDGATLAVNMIIPVVAGLIFGWRSGFVVGLLGTALNAASPAGSMFEVFAILPHAIMGAVAGLLKDEVPMPVAACALCIGHLLNVTLFVLVGLLSEEMLAHGTFWWALISEAFLGVIFIIVIVSIYTLVSEEENGVHN